jgi:alkylated DNA repair dioxygenase AlkB
VSVTTVLVLVCNHEDEAGRRCDDTCEARNTTVTVLRRFAEALGWSTDQRDGKDYCPDHPVKDSIGSTGSVVPSVPTG